MLPEAMTALAAAGGTAVVQAAGTDAWQGFRRRVAAWFGGEDAQRENSELERLDRTASDIRSADAGSAERMRIRQEALWQARFETLLEGLAEAERDRAARELRTLLDEQSASGASAGAGGQAVGGDLTVTAEGGSIAAGMIHGGAHIAHPPKPDPSRG